VVIGTSKVPAWEDVPPRLHSFGHCAVCKEPGVIETTESDYGVFGDEQLFPVLPRGLPKGLLRDRVEVSYREAAKCSAAEAWLATAVMVRRTLEAIGQEFDPKAKRLLDGLEAMKRQGVISEELLQWAHHLRVLGNHGAHPGDEVVAPEDGQEAMEFLEAIAETIYVLRPKFERMKRRRERTAPSMNQSDHCGPGSRPGTPKESTDEG
jgi:hypothetical protein